jgi:hypothetical protein
MKMSKSGRGLDWPRSLEILDKTLHLAYQNRHTFIIKIIELDF